MLRGAPWSTGDGLRLGLAAGGAQSAGMDEFYGRNMPAPPARVAEARLRARSRSCTRRHATVRNARRRGVRAAHVVGDRRRAVDRAPARRARLVRGAPTRTASVRVRDRTVGEMIDAGSRAGAPGERRDGVTTIEVVAGITTTLGGLRIDAARARGAGGLRGRRGRRRHRDRRIRERPRRRARVRPDRRRRSALGAVGCAPVQHAFGTSDPLTLGMEEELLLVDADTPPARARRRGGAGAGRAAGDAGRARGLRLGDRAAHAGVPQRRRGGRGAAAAARAAARRRRARR